MKSRFSLYLKDEHSYKWDYYFSCDNPKDLQSSAANQLSDEGFTGSIKIVREIYSAPTDTWVSMDVIFHREKN